MINLMKDDVNIKEMYDYQLKYLNDNNYQEYIKYLNIYFSKEIKKDKYNRSFENGKYILTEKSNEDKKIILSPSKYTNINKLYIDLKINLNLILSEISNLIQSKNNITENNREKFLLLSNQYKLYKNQLKDIENINKEFYNNIEILLNKKIEKTNELAKYYQKRVFTYSNILVMIPENLKNKLIKKFKDNKKKIPNNTEINKIAKDNLIPSEEVEKWFNWIELTYFYILISKDISNIDHEIKEKENNFEIQCKYMIIKKPNLEKK